MAPAVKVINEAYLNACIFEALMRALYNIYNRLKLEWRSRWAMTHTILVVAFFVLSTADLGSSWAYVMHAFIDEGETPESTAAALTEYLTWFLGALSFGDANAILADSVIIWRTWTIFEKSWLMVMIPIITTMLTVGALNYYQPFLLFYPKSALSPVFSIIAIYTTTRSTTFSVLNIDYATGLYTTTLITTIYCTGAIIYRIVRLGCFASCSRVLDVLVESAALYCIATIFALVANTTSGTASEFASAFWTSCSGIAPTLLVARAAAGHTSPTPWPWDHAFRDTFDQPLDMQQFASTPFSR